MKMSTRGRYALRAVVDLAIHYEDGPVLLKDIAERQDVSLKYLDHIIRPLREKGLIKRESGGYRLSRPPNEIATLEVVENVEGSLAPVPCINYPGNCSRKNICAAFDVWKSIKESIEAVLKTQSLKDLAEEQKRKCDKRAIT